MKRFAGPIGVENGSTILFNDFAHDGAMWTGSGPREVRQSQTFREPFQTVPVVTVGAQGLVVKVASLPYVVSALFTAFTRKWEVVLQVRPVIAPETLLLLAPAASGL